MTMTQNYNAGYERPGAGVPGGVTNAIDSGASTVTPPNEVMNGNPAHPLQPTAPTSVTNPDGSITTTNPDGTTSTSYQNGLSPNGQNLNETVNGITSSLNFTNAMDIIDSALQIVGMDPTQVATGGVNQGATLGQYFWSQIVNQGLTDPTTIGEMISTLLPSTGQFQTAFPGYQQALSNGYVRSVAQ